MPAEEGSTAGPACQGALLSRTCLLGRTPQPIATFLAKTTWRAESLLSRSPPQQAGSYMTGKVDSLSE
ncbi:hypothetical protein PCANC_05288 [Puccinia coronata f. sp. avenae]|uniref:Uncharacterized protein n=1 Tax=Puccinia coronata f. sp. avenae TaxID=200324 RepID=A0A2N5VYQ3_9BASI|nr:hypothetical protein PCANC_05288 [Puccinia coronata f. sp. avenae]